MVSTAVPQLGRRTLRPPLLLVQLPLDLQAIQTIALGRTQPVSLALVQDIFSAVMGSAAVRGSNITMVIFH